MLDILFAGELNIDAIMGGVRQMPVFGKEILAERYEEVAGSSTGNCACAAASLGLKTAIFSRLGTDNPGRIVLRALNKYNIDLSFLDISESYHTGVTVSLSSDVDRAMITCFGDTINCFDAEEIPIEAAGARHLHVGSFFLQPRIRKGLAGVFEKAHSLGMTTSLDAGWDEHGKWHDALDDVLRHTDFFFPNESEALAITGQSDPMKAAMELATLGCNAIVKLGGEGSVYCAAGSSEVLHVPAYKTCVVETTGAGDSFNAGFLYGYLNGREIEECMRLGNAVGALSVMRAGGSDNCPTLAEVLETIEKGTTL